MVNSKKLTLLKEILEGAEENLRTARRILTEMVGGETLEHEKAKYLPASRSEGSERIVEGVFDGENMVGPDGKIYRIPPNYASKSKLVEGDHLKLTIKEDGTFLYKQIGPVERHRVVGALLREGSDWRVTAEGKVYKVLLASVTYFRGTPGDEVVLLVPKQGPAKWGAVENLIKASDTRSVDDTTPAPPTEAKGEKRKRSPAPQDEIEKID